MKNKQLNNELEEGEDNDYKNLVKKVTADGKDLSEAQIKEMAEKIANTQSMAQKKGDILKTIGEGIGKVADAVDKLSDSDKKTLKDHIDTVAQSPEV